MVHVPTWHQGQVKASDARGAEVEVSGISWTTIAQLVPVRLGPGEFIEINTPGIGLGPHAGKGAWAGPCVGSHVLAKVGDELTLKHGLVSLDGSEVGVRDDDPHVAGLNPHHPPRRRERKRPGENGTTHRIVGSPASESVKSQNDDRIGSPRIDVKQASAFVQTKYSHF